jgi:hypothetical protein
MTYIIETRDRNERWHRPRLSKHASFAAACDAAAGITGITAWRIVNVATGTVEYTEIVL